MFSLSDSMRYWLWREPTDLRKGFHTLCGIVRQHMGRNPLDGDVYVFINRGRDRIRLLHWEPGGLVLYSKILERGTFGAPAGFEPDGSLAWRDLVILVQGVMTQGMTRRRRLDHLRKEAGRI